MRGVLWAVAAAIGACIFWVALAQLAFTATGTDPLDLLKRGEVGWGGIATLAIWAGGILIYAALARTKFRFERSRGGTSGHG